MTEETRGILGEMGIDRAMLELERLRGNEIPRGSMMEGRLNAIQIQLIKMRNDFRELQNTKTEGDE